MKNVASIAATNRIICLRDTQIMIDCDLAELYQVTTKALNQAVKRNNARFPSEFKFQLTTSEMTQLVTECDRFSTLKHRSAMPYAFTEQGVAMLSAILKSELAIEISIQIMNAFSRMDNLLPLIRENLLLPPPVDKLFIPPDFYANSCPF